jgi:hypothetical protein
VNGELERKCNEAVVANFFTCKILLPGRTEENHEKLSQDSQFPGRDFKT